MLDPKLNFHENRIIFLSVRRSKKCCQSQKKGQRALSDFKLGSAVRIDISASTYLAKMWFLSTECVYTFN